MNLNTTGQLMMMTVEPNSDPPGPVMNPHWTIPRNWNSITASAAHHRVGDSSPSPPYHEDRLIHGGQKVCASNSSKF